jgi:hypothetical protein
MAKQKKNIKQRSVKESIFSKFNLETYIPAKFQIPAVIVIILLLFLIFLNPLYFGGKAFQSGDIIATQSVQPYIEKDREGFSLWNPYIFCGMPAYAIGTEFTWFNIIYVIFTSVRDLFTGFFSNDYVKWSFYLIILGITSFFFMKYITKNTLVSLFTGVATAFSMGIIVFLFIGHVTKLTSLCMYPIIFFVLFRFQEKIRLLDVFILIIALQLFIQGFHVQIIFYTLFAVAVYFIYFFLRAVIKKENELRNNLIKSAGIFIFASIIAVLIQSDNLTQVYEYTPYSTRGTEGILEKTADKTEQTESDYYDYHTEWSFSPGEVLTFIVPSFYGFGNSTYKGPLSNNQEVDINTYFGQMRFVDVAVGYMGILVFFLALFAVFTRWKEPLVQFLTILSFIALLISFGKTFPILFDTLFYYLPYFNKFRVPSMILVLVQMSMPVLAGLGLMKIISQRTEKDQKILKAIKNLSILFTVVFALSLLLSSPISDWFVSRVNTYADSIQAARPQLAQQHRVLAEYTSEMFTGDLLLGFGILSLCFWCAHFYVSSKISPDMLAVIILILTIIDLWRIDARGAKYVEAPDIKNMFNTPDYVTAIKNQNDKEPFRLLNLKQDGSLGSLNSNSNYHAYFLLEDFYGYSGIKPRAFQDIIDVVGPANPTLWRMMNVKYIILGSSVQIAGLKPIFNSEKSFVYENESVLPRVYLVNKVEKKTEIEFLNMVKSSSFDPNETAFVHSADIKVDPTDSTAYSKITGYLEDKIDVEVNASGNNFLFLSNSYLPGWKATIDGNETQTYKTNHGYIGIVVPKGKHHIQFIYAPESFYLSKNIALILSSLVMLGLVITIFLEMKRRNKVQVV